MRNLTLLLLSATLFFSSCDNDEKSARRIQVRLTDAPGDYEAVNIDLLRVEAHASRGNEQNGWFELNTNSGVYNLLDLTNGIDTLIVDDVLPEGKISQIRLVLGDNNTVVVDGVTHDLTIPSGSQSGLKLNIHEEFLEGITYKVLLDFDAAKSVVKAGASGKYNLKPVIRTITEAQDGAIRGVVTPADAVPAVMAIQNEDTISTYANENGEFLLMAIPEGSYNVLIQPGEEYGSQTIANVSVLNGQVTTMDTVKLN
jgi:hypothetical protein